MHNLVMLSNDHLKVLQSMSQADPPGSNAFHSQESGASLANSPMDAARLPSTVKGLGSNTQQIRSIIFLEAHLILLEKTPAGYLRVHSYTHLTHCPQ